MQHDTDRRTIEPGALLDHASRTVEELNTDTIRLAADYGWRAADRDDWREVRRMLVVQAGEAGLAYWHPSATAEGLSEAFSWVADDSMDWLNDHHAPAGHAIYNDGEAGALVCALTDPVACLAADGGGVPCSRYGRTSAECAEVAVAVATIVARECDDGEPTTDHLDHAMSLVVNDHDDAESLIATYGPEHGYDPDDYLPDGWRERVQDGGAS